MNQDGIWLSILEYANVKKTSISTIRRSIKAGHLKYKEECGKYYIWTKEIHLGNSKDKEELGLKLEVQRLERLNRELQEEINDLKMLLGVYEQNSNDLKLPPLPQEMEL